jgi:hypothetical protein
MQTIAITLQYGVSKEGFAGLVVRADEMKDAAFAER